MDLRNSRPLTGIFTPHPCKSPEREGEIEKRRRYRSATPPTRSPTRPTRWISSKSKGGRTRTWPCCPSCSARRPAKTQHSCQTRHGARQVGMKVFLGVLRGGDCIAIGDARSAWRGCWTVWAPAEQGRTVQRSPKVTASQIVLFACSPCRSFPPRDFLK